MKLILVRHAESVWNEQGKYQGSADIPLSERGKREAVALAERLKNMKIDAAYSSNLSRAYDTAQIIAEPHGLDVKPVPELAEMNFGEWEGLTYIEIKERFGEESFQTWLHDPERVDIPGGEKFGDFADRIEQAMTQIAAAHRDDETILIVAHGAALMVYGCRLNKENLNCYRRYVHRNAAYSIVEFKGDTIVFEVINDFTHLDGFES
ncbi:MAG: histidine phosphatase family protein [Candidatus Saccharibacteria bacterium]